VVYNVNNVQPPNEYATGVNNSAFTNAAASAALEWAVAVADILNFTLPAKARATYLDVASNLKIPFDVQQQRHLGTHKLCIPR
jgi:trehalose/maltose hydrolase-like predicted phosphorylase